MKNESVVSEENNATQESHQATVIGLNSVKNLLGNEHQLNLFDEQNIQSLCKTYGIKLNSKIDRFGIDLTDTQTRVMEGLLRGFTMTNYKGNIDPIDKFDVVKEKYAFGDLPSTYKYVNHIPCLKATQSEILEWAGMNKRGHADRDRVVEALKHLGSVQYCFYYDRLALDKNGLPEKDIDGKWKKEEVTAVDTLFIIKEVRNKQDRILEYYEIIPSPLFLDQRESHFMLIPYNWREEVRAFVGNKKASSYTFQFLLFLRYQYELNRRSHKNEKTSFILKRKWEDIAIALKMPESVYKRKKDRACKILEDAYSVAKQLGYLRDYKREGDFDHLILNEQKYSNKGSYYQIDEIDGIKASLFSSESIKIFDLFHDEKKKRDAKHKMPTSKTKSSHLAEFEKLLKQYSSAEISKVIIWGINNKDWYSKLSTPIKLRQNFKKSFFTMSNS